MGPAKRRACRPSVRAAHSRRRGGSSPLHGPRISSSTTARRASAASFTHLLRGRRRGGAAVTRDRAETAGAAASGTVNTSTRGGTVRAGTGAAGCSGIGCGCSESTSVGSDQVASSSSGKASAGSRVAVCWPSGGDERFFSDRTTQSSNPARRMSAANMNCSNPRSMLRDLRYWCRPGPGSSPEPAIESRMSVSAWTFFIR